MENGLYYQYRGISLLEKLIVENIHNQYRFQKQWGSFKEIIQKISNKKIIGTTNSQMPSFSAALELEQKRFEQFTHIKRLHFSISLLGPFYQIYGLDQIILSEKATKKRYRGLGIPTISPFEEYKKAFELVEQQIKQHYPEHKIVPYVFGQTFVHGLEVRYLDSKDCTVNNALFNHFLDNSISQSLRGDKFYGMQMWKNV